MKANKFKLSYIIAFWPALFFVLAMLCLSTLSGCYDYDTGYYSHKHNNPERGPTIETAKVSCHYNYSYQDYIWYFDAWVHYPHYEFEDVSEVWAEVYDGLQFVDSFPLVRDREKFWTSWWIEGSETSLWCGNPYEIKFIAVDDYKNHDIMTVSPYY
jgi:hypothetical protein